VEDGLGDDEVDAVPDGGWGGGIGGEEEDGSSLWAVWWPLVPTR
jgi:hypothetical protein